MFWRHQCRFIIGVAVGICVAALAACKGSESARGAKVIIQTQPVDGAEVMVGGVSYGTTPATLELLPAGAALFVLSKDGYKRATKSVDIPAGGDITVTIELEAMTGLLTIITKPPGAKVLLDGQQELGMTPLREVPLPLGPHTYEVRLDNYRPETREITVEPEMKYTYAYDLVAEQARLGVLSRPTNARLWLNDEQQGQATPAQFNLAPGTYTVRVHSEGYVMCEQTVTIKPNEDRTVELAMQPGNAPEGMFLVGAGKFVLGLNGGSPDERPEREIELPAFYIDKFEVTNAEFKKVFSTHAFPQGSENYPVAGVSFQRATEYAQAIGKRLPTEEEWEKAARGSDKREYPWGQEFHKEFCNGKDQGGGETLKVGSFRQGVSPYGCADMAGNVYEWTSSWYQAYPGNTDITTEYGQVFRVLRGGSYQSDRFGVRCARRHYDRMDASRADYGFRCAKNVHP